MFRMQEWPVRVSYPIAEPSDLSGATIRFSRAGHIRNFSHRGMRDEDSEPAQLPYRRRRVQARFRVQIQIFDRHKVFE